MPLESCEIERTERTTGPKIRIEILVPLLGLAVGCMFVVIAALNIDSVIILGVEGEYVVSVPFVWASIILILVGAIIIYREYFRQRVDHVSRFVILIAGACLGIAVVFAVTYAPNDYVYILMIGTGISLCLISLYALVFPYYDIH